MLALVEIEALNILNWFCLRSKENATAEHVKRPCSRLFQFIHVPPLDCPYSADQMAVGIEVILKGIISQVLP